MPKLSVLIPARNERFLPQTVADLLAKATGDIEVIAVLDGYWPDPPLPEDPRLHILHRGRALGMRASNNAAAALAKGDFLLKVDAHCMFAKGYDEILMRDCPEDALLIPRRFSLDPEKWEILVTGKSPVDYHYLSCPLWSIVHKDDYSMHGIEDHVRGRLRRDKPEFQIDEQMSFQGSCYMMSKRWKQHLGPMQEEGYGGFSQEPQEIGNKTWLSGGRILVTKNTWYAHLHKGKQYGRMYSISGREIANGHVYAARYWMGNKWEQRIHDLQWLIERFWPVPDWPPEILNNWEKMVQEAEAKLG